MKKVIKKIIKKLKKAPPYENRRRKRRNERILALKQVKKGKKHGNDTR